MKWKDRGFWVSHHFYWQSLAYYFYYSVRFRSFTFFAAGDPAIDMGGMLDEEKSDIYALLPQDKLPKTIFYDGQPVTMKKLEKAGIIFPCITKPNIGFRGYKVVKANDLDQLNNFLKQQDQSREWLIQEFVDYKREFSILFYRYPSSAKKGITSFIEKIYPAISGDGFKSIGQLIEAYHNPFLDEEVIIDNWKDRWEEVPESGKKIILDPIGNYSRGAKFFSLQEKIDQELVEATARFFAEVKGLDFFRMDFKSDSIDAYKNGNFKILEVNGMKSEPLHMYDRIHGFWDNTKCIHQHWKIIRDIVKERNKQGTFRFPTTVHGLKALLAVKRLVK